MKRGKEKSRDIENYDAVFHKYLKGALSPFTNQRYEIASLSFKYVYRLNSSLRLIR